MRAGDHLDRLYRAAWALCGDREDAEDLVQETYARVLARPRWLRKDDDLGYLLQALRNTFLSEVRSRGRQLTGQAVSPDADPIDLRGYMRPERAAEARAIYAAIARLSDEFRLALVAVDVLGLSYQEAATTLRLPAGTVRSRVFRARERVAEDLEQAGGGEIATPAAKTCHAP